MMLKDPWDAFGSDSDAEGESELVSPPVIFR